MYYTSNGTDLYKGDKRIGDREATTSEINTYLANKDLASYQDSVKQALMETSTTVERIAEAVSLGNTTWTTNDVVTFMQYRADLRAEMSATVVGILPTKPPYPAGT